VARRGVPPQQWCARDLLRPFNPKQARLEGPQGGPGGTGAGQPGAVGRVQEVSDGGPVMGTWGAWSGGSTGAHGNGAQLKLMQVRTWVLTLGLGPWDPHPGALVHCLRDLLRCQAWPGRVSQGAYGRYGWVRDHGCSKHGLP